MRRSNLYLAIAIIGFTLAILTQENSQDQPLANTFYLATVFLIGLLYLYSELRYYRSHNAIIASSQFIIIPGILMVLSNFLAPTAWDGLVLDFSINLGILLIFTQSTLTSTIILIPMIVFLNLMSRYYQKRYSGFVIRRTIYGPIRIPFIIHLLTLTAISISSSQLDRIDFVLLVFYIWSIVMILNYLVIPAMSQPSERTDTRARAQYMEGILSRPRLRSSRDSRPSSRSDSPASQPRRRSGDIPTSSRSGSRNVSTFPSGGYRNISPGSSRESTSRPSTRSSSSSTRSSSSSSRPSRSEPTSRRSVAEIDEGISVGRRPREVVANLSGKGKRYLPSGVVTRDDLKCMVCYQDFSKGTSQQVSICPYCKFPAHKRELQMWLASSEFCPRCNKNLVNGSSLSLISIKENDYCKIRDSV